MRCPDCSGALEMVDKDSSYRGYLCHHCCKKYWWWEIEKDEEGM